MPAMPTCDRDDHQVPGRGGLGLKFLAVVPGTEAFFCLCGLNGNDDKNTSPIAASRAIRVVSFNKSIAVVCGISSLGFALAHR